MEKEIKKRLEDSAELAKLVAEKYSKDIAKAVEKIAETLRNGGKILFFGNGGSAAEAQHFSSEFVNRMLIERPPQPAIALSTDSSILTSVGNDRGFEEIFAVQIKALGSPKDVAFGISTSGKSPNVLLALKVAKEMGMFCMGLAGKPGSRIGDYCDLCLWVDSEEVPRIQEVHLMIGHIICELTDKVLFAK